MSASATALSKAIFTKMKNTPPEAQEQAEMFIDAMQEYMSEEVIMTVKQVNKKFAKITGAVKDKNNITQSAVVGRFGEVVVHEGVNKFFQNEEIRKKYSDYVIDGSSEVLIPADANKASQTRNAVKRHLLPLKQQIREIAQRQWKTNISKDSKTMPDFLMNNAVPLEVKAKTNSYIYWYKGEAEPKERKGSNPNKLSADNKYFEIFKKKKGTMLVGGVWVDTIWTEFVDDIEPFRGFNEESRKMYESIALAKGKKAGGKTLKIDYTNPGGKKWAEGKTFELVALKLNTFIPMVADRKQLIKIVKNKYILRSDMMARKAISEFTSKSIIEFIKIMRAEIAVN